MTLATPAVVMVSIAAGVPAAVVVLTAVDISGVPIKSLLLPTFLLLLTSLLLLVFPQRFWRSVLWLDSLLLLATLLLLPPCCCCLPAVVASLLGVPVVGVPVVGVP